MQTLILDSSQISNWYGCATQWANRGLIAINHAAPEETNYPSRAIASGTLGHKYLEIYYTTLAETNMDYQLAARATLGYDPVKEGILEHGYPKDQDVRDLVLRRIKEYWLFYPPSRDMVPAHKNVYAIAAHEGKLIDTVRKEALVEKGFSYKLFESSEYLFVLEGRIDFLGTSRDGTIFWCDHKFQEKEHVLYDKTIQFRNYALATGISLALINYVRLHKEISAKTFVRQPLSFSPLEMRYWREELIETYIAIAKQVTAQEFPKNWGSCGNLGGWGKSCMFNPICNERNPGTRAAILKRDFTTRKEWRPW